MFENYKDCLFNDKIILKSQQRFKSDHHNVYTKEINKETLIIIVMKIEMSKLKIGCIFQIIHTEC